MRNLTVIVLSLLTASYVFVALPLIAYGYYLYLEKSGDLGSVLQWAMGIGRMAIPCILLAALWWLGLRLTRKAGTAPT